MIYPLGFSGIRNGASFHVDEATKTSIVSKPTQIEGKVVTLTGNYTVGYGTSGDIPLGFVEKIEPEKSGSSDLIVSVVWNQAREDIPCVGSETAGSYLACDGTGGVKISGTSSAPVASRAVAYGVDSTAKTATVYIHG